MNKIGAEIMAKFDSLISGFGNTAEILQEAHEDLAADNAAAAAEDYGRCISHHHACECREAAFKSQIERLIDRGIPMSGFVDLDHNDVRTLWEYEVTRAKELIK